MEIGLTTELLGVIFGGGVGALLMQLYTAKANKRKIEVEIEDAVAEAEKKKQDNKHDAFDTIYHQLNTCMKDYTVLLEEYREYRQKTREHEDIIQVKIQQKCEELAAMKSKVTYLKGIRCYDALCKKRIMVNPDKQHPEPID